MNRSKRSASNTNAMQYILSRTIWTCIRCIVIIFFAVPLIDAICVRQFSDDLSMQSPSSISDSNRVPSATDSNMLAPDIPSSTPPAACANNASTLDPMISNTTVALSCDRTLSPQPYSYADIRSVTSSISLPLLAVIIPIIAILVPLQQVLKNEEGKHISKAYDFLRRVFYVGQHIEIVSAVSLPNFISIAAEHPTIGDYPLSFHFRLPDDVVFPGRGLIVESVQTDFIGSFSTCDHQGSGIVYNNPKHPINVDRLKYIPDIVFSIIVSDNIAKRNARAFAEGDTPNNVCYLTLVLSIDEWTDTGYMAEIKLLIEKKPMRQDGQLYQTFTVKQIISVDISMDNKET